MSNNDQDLTSIKELASQLKASDALLKKIIKDFEIETIRDQKRVCLSDESVQTIRDILALRASGKKNNEIKELFYASKGIEAKPEEPVEVTKVSKPSKASKEKEDDIATEENTDDSSVKKVLKSRKPRFAKEKKLKAEDAVSSEEESKTEEEQPVEKPLELAQKEKPAKANKRFEKEKDDSLLDLTQYLDEDGDDTSELKNLLDDDEEITDEEIADLDAEDEIAEAEEIEQSDDKLSPRKIRRRQFSFRYIQRQIANDSKRVSYLKQKLKRGKLSVKEKMLIEDSLYHRSNLLNGWVHLLRWVKS